MSFLASDLMRGRDTTSPEIRIAAEYLATRLAAFGAETTGDVDPVSGERTYFQHYPLARVTPRKEGTSLEVIIEKDGVRRTVPLAFGTDFARFPYGIVPEDVEAALVFVGYGLFDESQAIDDFKGLDLKGRWALVTEATPSQEEYAGKNLDDAASRRFDEIQRRGALGTIVVSSTRSGGDRAWNVLDGFERTTLRFGALDGVSPVLFLADAARDRLALSLGSDLQKPGVLEGVRARFRQRVDVEPLQDRNVIGFFPGSDPEKAKEVVIYSAHYDHVGDGGKGEIHNGSDDNASGTSALLEIAEAIGEGPRPARSVAFLWVSGEEHGLWGSEYFSEHPALPEGSKIVADINMDMVSRNDGHKVGLTPSPGHPEHNSMVALAVAAAKEEEVEITFDADEFFHRSDHANFARKGIPIVFFFSGIHEDYHKPTDDFTKADFEKAARIARIAYRLGWRVAQSPDLPAKQPPAEKTEAKSTGE